MVIVAVVLLFGGFVMAQAVKRYSIDNWLLRRLLGRVGNEAPDPEKEGAYLDVQEALKAVQHERHGLHQVVLGIVAAFSMESVVDGLELFWKIAAIMSIPFWVGLFWRRATAAAAWRSAGSVAPPVTNSTDRRAGGTCRPGPRNSAGPSGPGPSSDIRCATSQYSNSGSRTSAVAACSATPSQLFNSFKSCSRFWLRLNSCLRSGGML